MSHADKTRDVFISHSSKDKAIADAICAILESNQIRCWVAPRDIHPGTSWSEAIIEGLDQCKLVVVVFNSNSNQSDFVAREVERAASKGLPIIPFRTEEVLPSKGIELFVSGAHWLDAMTPPIESHIGKLVDVVSRFLNVDAEPLGIGKKRNSQEPALDENVQSIDKAGFSSSQLLEDPRSLVGQNIAGRYKLKQMSDQGGTNPYSNQRNASPALPSDPQYGRPMQFSRLGIWSFVLSLVSAFGLFAVVVFAGLVPIDSPDINNPDIQNNDPLFLIGMTAIGMALVGFASFTMAVISLFIPDRKKLFGILAIVFSLVFIAAIGLLTIVGLQV